MATGPNSILEMVNLAGAVYTKQGTLVKNFELASFFNTGFDFISDPKILYDPPSGRWFASLIDTTQCCFSPSNLTIAVSTSSDPAGLWKIYRISAGNLLPDQPIIGVNADKLVVSANDFSLSGSTATYLGAQYWVLNKIELLAGLSNIDTAIFGPSLGLFSVHPAQALSSSSTEYMVSNVFSSGNFVNNQVAILAINGVPPGKVTPTSSTMTISTIGTLANGAIPGGSQPGTNVTVNNDDQRIQDAAWFGGKLWFALNDGCTPTGDNQMRACFRLTKLDTSTLSIIQQFDVGSQGQSFYYPALRLDALGNLDLIYGYSSSSLAGGTDIYPSLAVTGQATSDPANTLATPQTLQTGSANDTTGRYGDYFGAALDPSNPSIVWVAGEYHTTATGLRYKLFGPGSFSNWSTFIGSIRMTKTDSSSIPITLSDYTLTSAPSNLVVSSGSPTSTILSLSSVGFSGTVALGISISCTAAHCPLTSLSPGSLTLSSGVSGTSNLTVSAGANVPTGFYAVNLTATAGSIFHSISLALLVNPTSFSTDKTLTLTGIRVHTNGTLSVDPAPTTTFTVSGSISVVATNSSTGSTLISTRYPIVKLPLHQSSDSNFVIACGAGECLETLLILDIPVSPYPLSSNLALTVDTVNCSPGCPRVNATMTRNVDINVDSVVNAADQSIMSSALGCSQGSSCYNPAADLDADGVVNAADQAILNSYFGAPDLIPSFYLSALPNLSINSGAMGTVTVSVTSNNTFAGSVSLGVSVSPPLVNGPTVSVSPSTVSIASGGSAKSNITVSTTSLSARGVYVVNATGTSGSTSRSVFFALAVTPITINISKSVVNFSSTNFQVNGSLSVDTGSSSTLTISGSLFVTVANASTGSIIFSDPYRIAQFPLRLAHTIGPGGSNPAFNFFRAFYLSAPIVPYHLAWVIGPSIPGPTATSLPNATYSIRNVRNPDLDLDGTFDVADYYTVYNALGCRMGTPCYDPRADAGATGFIDRSDQVLFQNTAGAPDFPPSFNISVNLSPTSLGLTKTRCGTIQTGTTATLNVTSLEIKPITILISYVPPNPTGGSSLTGPSSVTLQAGALQYVTLTAKFPNAIGDYLWSITLTDGVHAPWTVVPNMDLYYHQLPYCPG
jgi:hypothetical protein